jgi:hypothetical protein
MLAVAPLLAVVALPLPAGAQEKGEMNVSLSAMATAAGVLQPGESEGQRTLLVDRATLATLVIWSPVAFRASIRLADGSTLSPDDKDDERSLFDFDLAEDPELMLPAMGRGHDVVATFSQPPPGELEVLLVASEPVREAVPFTIALMQESDTRLGLVVPRPEVRLDEGVVVTALAFDRDKPIKGAAIDAFLIPVGEGAAADAKPAELALRDDGQMPDVRAGDGCYTGVLLPKDMGRHLLSVRARGRNGAGLAFARDVAATIEVKDK